jgi:hypothetical protein
VSPSTTFVPPLSLPFFSFSDDHHDGEQLHYFDVLVSRLEGVTQEANRWEEKPWNKPGADISDFFNYGFNDKTWDAYLKKQKALRSMDFSSPSASTISTANSNLSKALSIPTSSGSSDGINLTYSQAPSSFNNKGSFFLFIKKRKTTSLPFIPNSHTHHIILTSLEKKKKNKKKGPTTRRKGLMESRCS